MYRNLLQTQMQISYQDVMCIPYDIFNNNSNLSKNWFLNTFQEEPTDNSYIIYKIGEGFVVLGYIDFNDEEITKSKYYDLFRQTSLIHNGVDPTNNLLAQKNLHICRWVFDNCLKDEEILKQIFALFLHGENAIVWCDSSNRAEIIYYPVKKQNFIRALSHFVSKFLCE